MGLARTSAMPMAGARALFCAPLTAQTPPSDNTSMTRERSALFTGRHFEAEIIALCVRWYPRYPLSLGQLEEIMAERASITS
jgi:hypothetical protein